MKSVFDYFFTGTAIIRRPPPIIAGGKRSTAAPVRITVKVTALVGVTDDEARRQVRSPVLETPMEMAQIFASSDAMPFSRKGDDLILGGRTFPIRHVESWPIFHNETGVRFIVEKVDK